MTDDELVAKMVALWNDETEETETQAMTRVLALVREHDVDMYDAARAAGRLVGWNEGMEDAKAAAIAFGKKYRHAFPAGALPYEIANAIDSVKIAGPERIPVNGCEEGAVRR